MRSAKKKMSMCTFFYNTEDFVGTGNLTCKYQMKRHKTRPAELAHSST